MRRLLQAKNKSALAMTSHNQLISNPCHRFDFDGCAFEFFPQVGNVDIHRAGLSVKIEGSLGIAVIKPHMVVGC
jgi:hypothetical protein